MTASQPQTLPTVSIVVATRDRPAQLARLLECFEALDPKPAQVVIVENDERRLCEQLVGKHLATLPLRYVVEPVPGVARARNRGVHETTGEIVAFIDDDCEPRPDWVAQMAAPFAENPYVGVVGGRITSRLEERTLVEMFARLDASLSPFGGGRQ